MFLTHKHAWSIEGIKTFKEMKFSGKKETELYLIAEWRHKRLPLACNDACKKTRSVGVPLKARRGQCNDLIFYSLLRTSIKTSNISRDWLSTMARSVTRETCYATNILTKDSSDASHVRSLTHFDLFFYRDSVRLPRRHVESRNVRVASSYRTIYIRARSPDRLLI